MTAQKWVSTEISFKAKETVNCIHDAEIDVTFKNVESGTTLLLPAFWDGGCDWKVRFAPTETGIWFYTLNARGKDIGLDGITGQLTATEYSGDLEIYKRGFLKTEPNVRYLMYNDGTPFFYLGDTHWNVQKEEFDEPGPRAGDIQCESHFKYICDRRWEQGFTVYQTEPLGRKYKVEKGTIDESDIEGFRYFDGYFKYIADKGFVHANAELLFPALGEATEEFRNNLEILVRYWVARYASYPVLWTLGQEVDDLWNREPLPEMYKKMCEIITSIDPYHHPTSAHQVNTAGVGCLGGVPSSFCDGGYNEYDPTKNERTGKNRGSIFYNTKGHTWWAIQWRPCVDQQFNFDLPKDFWENGQGKPIINYEGRYDHLYTKEFGARVQTWISFLCGLCGCAYGAEDMWVYDGHYAQNADGFDGVDVITIPDKQIFWSDMINAPISGQMTIVRKFFDSIEWWRLTPDFDYGKVFTHLSGQNYAVSHIDDELYLVFLYDRTTDGVGKIINMDKSATYTARWFDTKSGEYTLIDGNIKGEEFIIPQKPQATDMLLVVSKN